MASNNTYSHSINLRYILESQKLSGENFLDWEKNLRIDLNCERKLYILKTDPPKTPAANARASKLTSFKKENACFLPIVFEGVTAKREERKEKPF
ncbi:unnamed protein product [Cuscuta campestris]|uniref:Uncharacterized protein n=1 Tax=Cuscuta campestris TaxID=132261 RepID=A0A484LN78_9ASTE|nr:unnamed protein product [Cuscuta campestris]